MKFFLFLVLMFNSFSSIPSHYFFKEQNQKEQITPKINKEIFSMLTLPDGKTFYAGTKKGLYKSTDGIEFSYIASSKINNKQINSLAKSSNGQILYLGTISGLYESTDGIEFNIIGADTIKSNSVSALLEDSNQHTIYAGTNNGLFQSTAENAFNFVRTVVNENVNALAISPDGKTIYVGTNKGIYEIPTYINTLKNNSLIIAAIILAIMLFSLNAMLITIYLIKIKHSYYKIS